jgi:hypothetical protein
MLINNLFYYNFINSKQVTFHVQRNEVNRGLSYEGSPNAYIEHLFQLVKPIVKEFNTRTNKKGLEGNLV